MRLERGKKYAENSNGNDPARGGARRSTWRGGGGSGRCHCRRRRHTCGGRSRGLGGRGRARVSLAQSVGGAAKVEVGDGGRAGGAVPASAVLPPLRARLGCEAVVAFRHVGLARSVAHVNHPCRARVDGHSSQAVGASGKVRLHVLIAESRRNHRWYRPRDAHRLEMR